MKRLCLFFVLHYSVKHEGEAVQNSGNMARILVLIEHCCENFANFADDHACVLRNIEVQLTQKSGELVLCLFVIFNLVGNLLEVLFFGRLWFPSKHLESKSGRGLKT